MTAVVLPRTGFKFVVAVRDGPDLGATFQILPPRVTIGRGGDNHIALSDPRVSRRAAVIDFTQDAITITDVSGRESLSVNGDPIQSCEIQDGDRFLIGETELKFVVEALPLPPVLARSGQQTYQASSLGDLLPDTPPHPFPQNQSSGPSVSRSNSPIDDERNKKIRFWLIVAVVVGAGVHYLTLDDKPHRKEGGIPTVEQIESGIKESEERAKAIEKRQFKSEEEKTRYRESQRHYLEGFRDYQRGQWGRAIRSFETAQAIDPQNEIAGRYKRLAEKRRDEMINIFTLEGRRYKEKSMYTRCSSAFEKVLELIPNRQDLKYQSAEALKKECDLMTDERSR